jgi:penicillin amidase/acyl-homoserine-lactone acylase
MRSRKKWLLGILLFIFITLIGVGIYIFWPQSVDLSYLANLNENYDVRILRDSWGVPHIFGVTDADTAFGLAYAHSEDDFLTIQQTVLAARGHLATVYGQSAAPNDYMVQLLRIWDVVEAGYDTDLMSESKVVIEAYADGLNYYAVHHGDEVLSQDLFPLSGEDMVAASVHKSPLFFGLDNTLGELFAESRQSELSPRNAAESVYPLNMAFGSNTFSIGPERTTDGSTYLAVNAHQPWEGAVTWYEAHLHSEEGWDVTGALFPGTPAIIHGHNRHLGWAFTVNNPDLADVYVLTINPDDENQYLFDGEWLDFEVREAPIKVNIIGRLTITIKEEALWSVYGPVVRQDHGIYALRYAGFGKVNIFEQLYLMNKAANFTEWYEAMKNGGLASFNVGYSDREGNIFYLYNAMLPIRSENYDWSLYLPGDTSETLWTEYLPFEELPQVLNPGSGFVQNCNSTPFQITLDPWNPDEARYSTTFGIETFMTNRSTRAMELFSSDNSISFEEFKDYKYDMAYSTQSDVAKVLDILVEEYTPGDTDTKAALEIVSKWDLKNLPDSEGATIMFFTLYHMLENGAGIRGSRLMDGEFTLQGIWDGFDQAVETLNDNFGTVKVPWSEVNRLIRGDVDLGLGGGADLLHAIAGRLQEDGRLKGYVGDSYVMLVRWDVEGELESFSIHQYGSATLDESSPHYADQSPLFAQRELKPVWFEESEIRANLEGEYRPGEEISTEP